MSSVFLGGSRKLSSLNSQLRTRIRSLMNNKHTILVGDANGADKAVQSFLAEEGYRNVKVYCMDGECRNNVGSWELVSIDSGGRKKDFQYFSLKDAEMSRTADYGFMLWDGKSKGTLNNVLNLIQQNKFMLVYFSPQKEFFSIKGASDVRALVENCDAESKNLFEKTIKFSERSQTHQASFNFA